MAITSIEFCFMEVCLRRSWGENISEVTAVFSSGGKSSGYCYETIITVLLVKNNTGEYL